MIRICFAAPHAYGLFDQATQVVFGGAEVRAFLLGNALSLLPGTQVSFVVFHDKSVEHERFGDIQVWRQARIAHSDPGNPYALSRYLQRTADFPFVRIVRVTWRMLIAVALHAMAILSKAITQMLSPAGLSINGHQISPASIRVFDAIDADFYAVFGASTYAAELTAYCRSRKKKLILFLSTDADLSPAYQPHSRQTNVYGSRHDLCHYALMQADLIISQTQHQRKTLLQRLGRDSVVIPNPIELGTSPPPEFSQRRYVLWIGKADTVKQPEILLRLAAEFPEMRFLMLLNRSQPEMFERVSIALPSNVELRDFVPYSEIDGLFRDAWALVNTSEFEGFPNTFLQAGKSGTPVLSLNADPDDFLARNACGFPAGGDYRRLAQELALLHNNESRWRTYSENIAAHVKTHHEIKSVTLRLKQTLMENK